MTGIKVDQLTKSYGTKAALSSVTFEIAAGSVAALIGENGAGKSTLLRILAGLARHDSGTVQINGAAPTQRAAWLSQIGFVDQEASLIAASTLKRHSQIGKGVNLRWNEELLMQRLGRLGIPADRPVKVLSGGQRQAAATLLALAKEPSTLVLDEPLAALDPLMRRELLGILLSHAYDSGATVLLSSHLVNDLERACDHIVLLSKGSVALSERTEQILNTHYWIANSPRNKELLQEQSGSFFSIETGGNLLLCTREEALLDQLDAKPAGLEEIILAKMADVRRPAEKQQGERAGS